MAKIWREEADPAKHADFLSARDEAGIPVEAAKDNLLDKWVYFADVCGFTFQFASMEQVEEALP